MVCFVHDHHFLSKFHAAINQLRKTNEFTILTLRQLPKRCCSCPEKRNNMVSKTIESSLKSMDINELRLICLRLDLKQYIATHILSSPSKICNYTILSFPTFSNSKMQDIISNNFTVQHDNQLRTLQKMHHVSLEFVTSNTSQELFNEIAQIKFDIIAKCSNYLEAIQAINGLWVIISTKDQSRVDIVEHMLQQQWIRFIGNISIYTTQMLYHWQQHQPSKVINNKHLNLVQSKINKQKKSNKQAAKLCTLFQTSNVIEETADTSDELENEIHFTSECSSDEMLMMTNPRFNFLFNRYDNSNKFRRPRTHRRQHMLAIAMAA
ncbi:unnamed protein product [Rotaria sordida]|uniref:Uncharacterized protein n=1 Tax=Rotaria sordida TaxID=392033 RepID=A0A813RCW8_9BILA|nr:unnamed protein product [Rotaria sordida]